MGVCVQGVQAAVVTPACGCNVPEGSTGRDRAVFNLDTLLRLPGQDTPTIARERTMVCILNKPRYDTIVTETPR